jgi:hypothetical protein
LGDADRERVVEELQRHYVAGRLSSDELSERVSTTLQARTFGDLAAVLGDLPNEQAIAPTAEHPVEHRARRWRSTAPMMLGLILVAVGLVLLVSMQFGALGGRGGIPFWPIFFFGFFFFGWPRGGRHRHF